MSEPSEKLRWWRDAVLYQIYPRSFQDTNGDGVGDLPGITERLDYLSRLGVDAIWISPFFLSPMEDFGYDVKDHRAVDPLFGKLEDFDELLNQAHQRNIRVLIDLVLNHSSNQHPWFRESRATRDGPYADHYVWADPRPDGTFPNNWLSIFGGAAWTWEPQREQYYLHNFLSSQPDLNFHHPAVRQEALDIARWWLERGVDGFRLDTVNFYFHDTSLRDNPPADKADDQVVSLGNPYGLQTHLFDKNRPEVLSFLDAFGELLAEYPGAMALGEVGATEERAISLMHAYTEPGRLHLCYTFDLLSHELTPSLFKKTIHKGQREGRNLWRCLAFSNHDVERTASRFGGPDAPADKIAPLCMALLLTLRGTPCIYQGEELGYSESELPFEALVDPYGIAFWPAFKGRDGCRTPMAWSDKAPNADFTKEDVPPWLPLDGAHRALNAATQEQREESMWRNTQRLLSLRKQEPALRGDNLEVMESADPILAFMRGAEESWLLCVFNLGKETERYPLPEHVEGYAHIAGDITLEQGELGPLIKLDPWAWGVLRLS